MDNEDSQEYSPPQLSKQDPADDLKQARQHDQENGQADDSAAEAVQTQGRQAGTNNNNLVSNENSTNNVTKRKYVKRAKPKHDQGSECSNDKKQGRWTREEKQLFIDALHIHGKDWKKVEQHIKTRSGAQIRSHAQKFFMNVQRSKGMDIDQYIKHIQVNQAGPSRATQNDLTENTGAQADSDDDNKHHEEINAPNLLSSVRKSSSRDHLLKSKTKRTEESASYSARQQPNPKKDKKISISEVDSSFKAGRLENSLSDMSAAQLKQQLHGLEAQQLLNQLQNQKFLGAGKTALGSRHNSALQLLQQMEAQSANQHVVDYSSPQFLMDINNQLENAQKMNLNKFEENPQNMQQTYGQKKLKLSPSKIHSHNKNAPDLRTARWATQRNINSSLNTINNAENEADNSPKKIPICDGTHLSMRVLSKKQIISFEEVWKLMESKKESKHVNSQVYSDRLSQSYPEYPNILSIPDILRNLKEELEHLEQIFNMDAIKVEWHLNKNELYVTDFRDKLPERKPNGPILILNLFEKVVNQKQTQKARFRNIQTKQIVEMKDLMLQNGTLLILKGKNVSNISYEVPKVTQKISEQLGRRITITFFQLNPVQINQPQHMLEQSPIQMAINGKTPQFGKQKLPPNQQLLNYANLSNSFFGLGTLHENNLFQMSNPRNKLTSTQSIENLLASQYAKIPTMLGNKPSLSNISGSNNRIGGGQRERLYSGNQDSYSGLPNSITHQGHSSNIKRKFGANNKDFQKQLRGILNKFSEEPSPRLEKSQNHSILVSRKDSPQSTNSCKMLNQFLMKQPGQPQNQLLRTQNNQGQNVRPSLKLQSYLNQEKTQRQAKNQANDQDAVLKSLISRISTNKMANQHQLFNQTQGSGQASPISQISRQHQGNALGGDLRSLFQHQPPVNTLPTSFGNFNQKQRLLKKPLENLSVMQNNTKIAELSGTPSEHQRNNKLAEDTSMKLIKAMIMGKGPGFPGRGISEISARSGFSVGHLFDRKFQNSLKKPFARPLGQKDSGEGMRMQNERKDQFHEVLSRRQSQISNISSFLGMHAVVDRHTSNGGNDADVEMGKPNTSDVNEPTIQSVQQMLNNQINKNSNLIMKSSPQKLASNDYQNSVNENNQSYKKKSNIGGTDQLRSLESMNQSKEPGESSQINDFSEVIKCIETKKNFLYFHFINNIGKHFRKDIDQGKEGGSGATPEQEQILSASAVDFLQSYNDLYVQIQEKQLQLFMKALMLYSDNERQQNKNRLTRLRKNLIDNDIVKNMVETLNIQILIKIVLQLYDKLKSLNQKREFPMKDDSLLSFDQISPIKMDFFQQLIPQSYTQELNDRYKKSMLTLQKYEEKEKNNSISQDNLLLMSNPLMQDILGIPDSDNILNQQVDRSEPDTSLRNQLPVKTPQYQIQQQSARNESKDIDQNNKHSTDGLFTLKNFIQNQQSHKIKPGISRDVSEKRKFENQSNISESSQLRKRETKMNQKQLMMAIQRINPEQNNDYDKISQQDIENYIKNQGERFSFMQPIRQAVAEQQIDEPANVMRQFSFQPSQQQEPKQEKAKKNEYLNLDETFLSIVKSLSPEPDKLISQQLNNQNNSDDDDEDMQPELKKQKKSQSPSQQHENNQFLQLPLNGQAGDKIMEANDDESAEQEFKSVWKQIQEQGDDVNIDKVIQNLWIQNKNLNSKVSQLLQDPRLTNQDNKLNFEGLINDQIMHPEGDSEQELRRLIHEKTRGIRVGGFRPAAYSADNQHQQQQQNHKSLPQTSLVINEKINLAADLDEEQPEDTSKQEKNGSSKIEDLEEIDAPNSIKQIEQPAESNGLLNQSLKQQSKKEEEEANQEDDPELDRDNSTEKNAGIDDDDLKKYSNLLDMFKQQQLHQQSESQQRDGLPLNQQTEANQLDDKASQEQDHQLAELEKALIQMQASSMSNPQEQINASEMHSLALFNNISSQINNLQAGHQKEQPDFENQEQVMESGQRSEIDGADNSKDGHQQNSNQ